VIKSDRALTPHETFYWQSQGSKENPQWAVLDGNWKLLHSPYESKAEELNRENLLLVNIQKDPGEHHNVAEQHPDIVARLLGKYRLWIEEVNQ
jgi:arylsulfatase A